MNPGTSIPSNASSGSASPGSLGEPLYRFPASLAQQSFWYLDRLEPGDPCWNIAVRFRLVGPLDVSLLQNDLSSLPLPARDAEEERRTIAEAALPFDLKIGPLLRVRLLKLAKQEHMLLLTIHHIISDGWSVGLFSDEIAAHYEALSSGNLSTSPDLPLQYADYTIWKNEQNESAIGAEHRSYWQTKLVNLPVCEIPPDYSRPPGNVQPAYILSLVLPASLTDSLAALARSHGCTLYTLSLAALKMLIAYYARQHDVYVGTLLAGRDRVELEALIGAFINTMILRTDLSGDPTFLDLLARVQRTVDEGMAHQDLHFQQVVEALRLKRDPNRPTVYSINFIYQRDFVKPLQFAGINMTPVPSKSPGAIYDLNFFMVQRSDGWRLSCEYDCDMYESSTVNRLIGQLRHLLEQIVANPNRKLSEFQFPDGAGDPLPPFVPRSNYVTSPQSPESSSTVDRSNSGGLVVRKILSRVYTQLGKI